MAITHTQLLDWTLVTGTPTSTTTASVTVPANTLVLVTVDANNSGGFADIPESITFNADNTTATQKNNVQVNTNRSGSIWFSQKATARVGTITIVWSLSYPTTTAIYRVDTFPGTSIDIAGNGGGPLVSSSATGTSTGPTTTLAGALSTGAVLYGLCVVNSATATFTAGTNFTKLGTDTNNGGSTTVSCEWWQTPATSNQTVNYTLSASVPWGIIALEIDPPTDQTITPTGIASAQAIGSSNVTDLATITPTGIASAQAIGAATLTQGAAVVLPAGVNCLTMAAVANGDMESRLPSTAQVGMGLPLLLSSSFRPRAGPATLPLLFTPAPTGQYLPSQYGVPLLAPGASLPLLFGNRTYTFSAFFRPATTVRTVFLRLLFFDKNNNFVGSANGTQVAESASGWVQVTVTAAAPAGAQYAGFALVVLAPVAGEVHYVAEPQFELGGSASAWQPSRQVNVTVLADRVNRCENPSFETSTYKWSYSPGVAFTRSTAVTPLTGQAVGQLTASGAVSAMSLTSSVSIIVVPGARHVFSAYWRAASTSRTMGISVQWFDAFGLQVGTSTNYPAGQQDNSSGWTRTVLLATAPAKAVTALMTTGVTGAIPNAETHYVDDVMVEQADVVGSYFDAASGTPLSDYVWEGVIHLSRSHYYQRRATKNNRLTARLPDFLPANATLGPLLYAQSLAVSITTGGYAGGYSGGYGG